ncbi:MAG: hypothetical protein HONDAALG_03900 [Gammaproteobacteria bacterium]|nr:hypothetical protein [Gammaproteobacteria bacterium]
MNPDERVFCAHLEQGPFQSGVDRGRWRLVSVNWPYSVIAVKAAERTNAPPEYAFRFELGNYPAAAPTARPWNEDSDTPLERQRWPGGRGRLQYAFNPDWKGGSGLYLPCDRHAIEGHDPWRAQHPEMIWDPRGDITQYLRIIHDLLNSEDYTGVRGA